MQQGPQRRIAGGRNPKKDLFELGDMLQGSHLGACSHHASAPRPTADERVVGLAQVAQKSLCRCILWKRSNCILGR